MSIKKKSDATIRSEERYNQVKEIYLKHRNELNNTQIFVQYVSKIASQKILGKVIKDLKQQENAQPDGKVLEVA